MKAFLPGILLLCSLVFTSVAAEPKKVLVVTTTTGFRHSSIPQLEEMLRDLSARSGGAFDYHRDQTGVDCLIEDPGHPATAALPRPWPLATKWSTSSWRSMPSS